MGQESYAAPIRFNRFLGLNNKVSDESINIAESSGLQNVNITEESLEQRRGSTFLTNDTFKDKTDTTAKTIVGLYDTKLNGNQYKVAIGGDAFKEFTGATWVDRTGGVTLTDDQDNLASFATFFDNSVNEIIIGCKEGDAPIKWTGSGNAAVLSGVPGNFKWPVVYFNKLWVVIGDTVYWSGLRNGESWDLLFDLQRFSGDDITGLVLYAKRLIVFQPKAIHAISGTDLNSLYIETIVTGEGAAGGYSIQEIESRRYGNILAFMSTEGVFKGFNGTNTLLKLGDPARPLFDTMNKTRLDKVTSMNYRKLNQYWASMSYGSDSENSQIMIYDYFNDIYTDEQINKPLSTILYHIGINAHAMAIWKDSGGNELPYTTDYNGYVLRQDNGLTDEESKAIVSKWQTGKVSFGRPSHVKLLVDLGIVTTQRTVTTLGIAVSTQNTSGIAEADIVIAVSGSTWGDMVWGIGLWSGGNTGYTRCPLTANIGERAVSGRYFLFQINHGAINESMKVEELIPVVTDLGSQTQYIE